MVFLAVFMMPFYYGSKARSVPEYLKLRFDERTRCLNSISFAVMTVFASGHFDALPGAVVGSASGLELPRQPLDLLGGGVGLCAQGRA